jgi:hypothetical protein
MRLLASPRRRRRLAVLAALALIVAPLVYVGVHYSTPGSSGNATGPNVNENAFYRQPKHVPFSAADQRAVRKVLAEFIRTAVTRHDVAASWDLAGPELRQGFTKGQWRKGGIPVVPYPAAAHGQGAWDVVDYSYRNKVGLEALLFPKPRSGYSIATVDTELVKGHDGRWRVDYWMITKFHGPGATAAADSPSALSEGPPNVHKLPGKKKAARGASPRPPSTGAKARLGKVWLLVPLALLSLIILIPVGFGTAAWRRNRREMRAVRP